MSILIKGMKMPRDCQQCPCAYWVNQFTFLGCNVKPGKRYAMRDEEYRNSITRPDWCPLVSVQTPHGRLIDADELHEKMYHESFEVDSDMQKWESGCWIRYKVFENCENQTPTIIEAEE